jgi:hypothetical protein
LDGPVEGRWLGRDLGHIWLMHWAREVSHRVVFKMGVESFVSFVATPSRMEPPDVPSGEGRSADGAEKARSGPFRRRSEHLVFRNAEERRSDVSRNSGCSKEPMAGLDAGCYLTCYD